MKRKIELYLSKKSNTLYVMMPNGTSYYVTREGKVGKTYGQRGLVVSNMLGGTYENATFITELTPAAVRRMQAK
jgi:hypothetical protein